MFIDRNTLKLYNDYDSYTDESTGVSYPYNYPKNEIYNLLPVQESTPPDGIITGFTVELLNGVYTKVYSVREKTIEEINNEKRNEAINTLNGLDVLLPRVTEDIYEAIGWDKAYSKTLEIHNKKEELRNLIRQIS